MVLYHAIQCYANSSGFLLNKSKILDHDNYTWTWAGRVCLRAWSTGIGHRQTGLEPVDGGPCRA